MVANILNLFKHSTKSYDTIGDGASSPEKINHSTSSLHKFSEKFHSNKNKPTPNWVHKTHDKAGQVTQEWDNNKKEESIDHAFNALNIQQDLYAYKRDELSQGKAKSSFSCINYFSKEHKMGRALNQEMTQAFFPNETRGERCKRWGGEFIRGATQPLDILPRNILKAFAPLPPGLSNLINHAALTFLDPLAQQAADVAQKLSPGSVVSRPDIMRIQQNGISTAHQMSARKAQLEAVATRLKAYCQIVADASNLTGKARESKLGEIEKAADELFDAMAETDEAVAAYKGDTYKRKEKIRENMLQGLVRAAWAVSVTPVSQAFNILSGGIIPRADVLLRQGVQMAGAGVDYIHAQDYVRGRHIKSPIGIFTKEAIDAGFHMSLPNMDKTNARVAVLKHIAISNNASNIRNKFPDIYWEGVASDDLHQYPKEQLNEIINSEVVCQCVKEFLFSPNKIQDKITHYSEEKIDAIKYNAMQKIAKMQREHAKLYRQLKYIQNDIATKGINSDYSEQNAKKKKVYSEPEILELISKNKAEQDRFDDEYRLFEQATVYALSQKNRDIKVDPNWAYSLDELYKKYPDSSMLKQLKSNTKLMWKTFSNNVVRDPATWRNETLFRQNQFPIFAIDNTLSELNKIADDLPHTNLNVNDWALHKEVVSFISNGAFFAPQVVISMWMYQENMRRFGRPKHHSFYVKVMSEKSKFILAQNKTEKVKLEAKLKNNLKYEERQKIQSKLDCVNFILENMPKQMASLELFNGNPQTFANLLNKPELKIQDDTKIELANSIAGMAAGLINPVSKITQRSNAIDVQGQALKLSEKINPHVKTGGINIPQTWYNIKTTVNPYHGKEHIDQIKRVFEEHNANNVFDAFSVYGTADNKDGKLECPNHLGQVCLDIFNQISDDRVADKSLFIARLSENNRVIETKLKTLVNQLSNNLSNSRKLEIYSQARKYQAFHGQIQAFLDRVSLPIEQGGFAGVISENKTINLMSYDGQNQKRNIDLSVSGHYTHALERDPFLDVKALNSKKIFSWGKTKNIAKTAVIPATRFIFEEVPRHLVTTPFTIVRGLSDLELARRENKKTRIMQEAVRRTFFENNSQDGEQHNLTTLLKEKADNDFALAIQENDEVSQQKAQDRLARLDVNSSSNRAPRYKKAVDKSINKSIQSNGMFSNLRFDVLAKPQFDKLQYSY